MQIDFLNPPGLSPTFGWSHVVSASGGRTIHVSGQAGIDEHGQIVAKGDLKAQTERTFKNLEIALAAAGAKFSDVVKMNIYVVNFQSAQLPVIREVRSRYVSKERPPASTLAGVTALAVADWLIEIDVTAVAPA